MLLWPLAIHKGACDRDGSITVSVYRKATNTDRYLDFKSHHHTQHKHSVARTLMDRAKNIPSTEEEVTRETKRVARALAANNYPVNFIHSGCQPNRQQQMNDTDQRGLMLSCPTLKVFPRESQKFFEISTSRLPISLFAPSPTYSKSQKTRSRKRLPEESYTRSSVKTVILFTLVRHRAR